MDGSDVRKKPRLPLDEKSSADAYDLMNHLYDELVAKILSHLSSPSDRCNSAAVSKKWLHMLATMQVVDCGNTNYSERLSGRKVSDIKLASLALRAYHFGSLTTLFILEDPTSTSISDYGLGVIAKASPRLKFLTLWDCTSIGDAGFKSVGRWCKDLQTLEVVNCPLVNDEGLMSIADNCLDLSSLYLMSCLFGCRSLLVFANKCLKLTSISIINCPLVGDLGIISVVSSLPQLERMKLSAMEIGDSVLEAIAIHGKPLLSLHLETIEGPTVKGYSSIGAKGAELNCLNLIDCEGFSGAIFKVPIANKFAGLEKLEIKGCDSCTDEVLIELSKSAKLMRILRLRQCTGFTSVGLLEALVYWRQSLKELYMKQCYIIEALELLELKHPLVPDIYPSLDTLKLKKCGGIGDLFISYMALVCDQVKNVSLVGMVSITDQSLLSLSIHLNTPNSLSSLNLSGCTRITALAIDTIVKPMGRQLRSLKLAGCSGLDDYAMRSIGLYCFELIVLNVSRCAISDTGVHLLMMSPWNNMLQKISLAGCTKLTDLSLNCLKYVRRGVLIDLDISGCPRFSATAIDHLHKALLNSCVIASITS